MLRLSESSIGNAVTRSDHIFSATWLLNKINCLWPKRKSKNICSSTKLKKSQSYIGFSTFNVGKLASTAPGLFKFPSSFDYLPFVPWGHFLLLKLETEVLWEGEPIACNCILKELCVWLFCEIQFRYKQCFMHFS